MKIRNIYRSKSDFSNMGKSELIALQFVQPFYSHETEDTERIKEKSLPIHTLFNSVYTITDKLKNEEMPELFIDEIWDDIKHIRGKQHAERPVANLIGLDYDYNVNRWYEATVIFACVYVVMALDYPEKEECLNKIKSKAAYNVDAESYFRVFESKLTKLQNTMKAHPDAYGNNNMGGAVKETKTYTEDEWITKEKHSSWRLDKLRKEVCNKPLEEQFQLYIAELKHEQSLPNPSKIYQDLLDIQIRALQKQLSEKNDPAVNVKDILEVLAQNNFSTQKQADLLQILNYVLYSKQYPADICGNLEKKIQLLQQPTEEEMSEKDATNIAPVKVRSVVILELLKKLQLGTAQNDLTKICRLIAFITGNSYSSIYNELQKGVSFSKTHTRHIDEVNKILAELKLSLSIDKNKDY